MDELFTKKLLTDLIPLLEPSRIEPINMTEFYTRLGIGRTKAYAMKRKGLLVKGRHYMQYGRTVIFFWGQDLIKKLMEDCISRDAPMLANKHGVSEIIQSGFLTSKKINANEKKGRRTKAKTTIDKDYCISF